MPRERDDSYYEDIKARFAAERDLRLRYRPEGTRHYLTDLSGSLAGYEVDPYGGEVVERPSINDEVDVVCIGAGFSGLLTAVRLKQLGLHSIRLIERAADVGGTWYWNRYPGVACDVVSYDYLPLLDETGYVPSRRYAPGHEIFEHCQAIARKYELYDLALFQTVVESTTWDDRDERWVLRTNRGDHVRARFVVCANGTLTKPKLARIAGMETFSGHSFHTSRWDYGYTGQDLEHLADKRVGIIGTGATAVQAVPAVAAKAKDLFVFQRTPSSIDVRDDWATDPEWASTRSAGWQAARRAKRLADPPMLVNMDSVDEASMERDPRIVQQERINIDYMMRIHRRIDSIVNDPATAEALKPWYMFMCKRPCFHEDYLPAFNRENVHLVDTHGRGVTEILPEGPVFDGNIYELDLLIYATGFEVQKTGTWNVITGEGGVTLDEKYRDGIATLFGVSSKGFPNLFIMGGYQSSFQFNLTDVLQEEGEHIAACIMYTIDHGHSTIDAREQAEQWWVEEVIKHRGKTSRNAECTPGYYNFEGEFNRRQDGNYNGGFLAYAQHMRTARANPPEFYDLG